MVAMSSIVLPHARLGRRPLKNLGTRRAARWTPGSTRQLTEDRVRLLQNASVFQLDQLVQIEIFEAVALGQFDELRRDALYFRTDDFIHIGLEPGGLQTLNIFGGQALHFE